MQIVKGLVSVVVLGWGLTVWGQTPAFDSSGNGLLNGSYYFREVIYVVGDLSGSLGHAYSVYGTINFDGAGKYTITGGQVMDSTLGLPDPLACFVSGTTCSSSGAAVSGTYTLAASGYGALSSPVSGGDYIYVLAANGVLTGSTTEGGFNDLFIGAKIGSPVPANSTFNGTWAMAGYIPAGSPANAAGLFFSLAPDGAGTLGTVNISGVLGSSNKVVTQSTPNMKYFFSSGAAVVTFPTSSTAVYFVGQEYLYFSPDGNFVFGGSPTGYDMLVGVRSEASSVKEDASGLYYQAGIDQDLSLFSKTQAANLDTYYGSIGAAGGSIVGSQRLQSVFNSTAITSTFADTYPANIAGSSTVADTFTQYVYGSGGAVRIGSGIWPYLGLTVAFKAPVLTGTGVFLNPTGVVNAASSAPFTAGIANGELLTLYGTNLAASTVVAGGTTFPMSLGGVTVSINGLSAPIYYVSPGQISVIVPYGNTFGIAQIQVTNNGVASNVVTQFVNKSSVGVFTVPAGGLGSGALVHNETGQLVSKANPAVAGEYLQMFATGLGSVFPGVDDGLAGPVSPLSYSTYFNTDATKNQIRVLVGNVTAAVVYAGLAPNLTGLYQINFQVPSGLTAGDNTLDLSGPDSFTAQAVIAVGGAGTVTSSVVRVPATGRKPLAAQRPGVLRNSLKVPMGLGAR